MRFEQTRNGADFNGGNNCNFVHKLPFKVNCFHIGFAFFERLNFGYHYQVYKRSLPAFEQNFICNQLGLIC